MARATRLCVFGAAGAAALVFAATLLLAPSAQAQAPGSDVSVTQTDSPDPVHAVQRLTYEVTVTNGGPAPAVVGLTVDIPEGSDVISASSGCSISATGEVACLVFPALFPGGSDDIEIVTVPRRVGTIVSVATATPLLPQLDPNPANNVAEEPTEVLPVIGPRNCRGREPTIVADSDGGVLRGTKSDDVIVGLDGNDKIRGGGGKDRICGAGGNDVIKGGGGADNLKGGSGDDEVSGGRRNDKLAGSSGSDELSGQTGDDRLRGSADSDLLKGGSGDDRATGGGGDDEINGSSGNDLLTGHGGADAINGRSGKDLLIGGGGENALDGGSGRDRCRGAGTAVRCEREVKA
jgi:Ca2+-binding RTX toxin-like protein